MSRALVCDNCDVALPLNARGENDEGEDSAWIVVSLANQRFDLCTRSCVVAFLERPEVTTAHATVMASVTGELRVNGVPIGSWRDDPADLADAYFAVVASRSTSTGSR